MREVWKDIVGFEGRFKISNHGNVLSINGKYKGERLLEPHIAKDGYKRVNLRSCGKLQRERVHRIVAKHFIQQQDKSQTWINHIDGNKLNNRVDNLEWVTPARNCAHAVETGLHDLKGEKHPQVKLTEKDVELIVELRNQGLPHQLIADKIGKISRRQISDILAGKCWGWFTGLG